MTLQETDPGTADARRRRRALYRAAHRGTKEMDWLLGKFADAHVAGMDEVELQQFEMLLSVADPDLQQWILEPASCAKSDFAGLIGQLRAFHKLDQ